ncbi:MAG: ATP-grasp domain-containing protein [Planctomycetes bacterium]|nr:ATP-grasp domain-containing protein [Planctomycetota bacterium]
MNKCRITILFDTDYEPPVNQDFSKQMQSSDEAEFDVGRALIERGHDVRLIGIHNRVDALLGALQNGVGEVVFNLTEGFAGRSSLDYAVAALLELTGCTYTGTPPYGLVVTRDKALTKKILHHHGIRVPHFTVYPRDTWEQRPSDLRFPLIVKPLSEDASIGIAKASIVRDDQSLRERVEFVHSRLACDVIVEELIVGRELYLGVLGNDPPRPLPPVEMIFENLPEESRIATYKAKWSAKYRQTKGIKNVMAKDLPAEVLQRLADVAVRAYRVLGLRDYGRIDVRLAPDNAIYVLEANPNPFIARAEDLPNAAQEAGMPYPEFIETIAACALKRKPTV